MSYKLIKDPITNKTDSVLRKADSACIPMAEGNRDYQEYLAWVAEGNTPEEAD
tara:strand:+ start:373 stop:531 length:159 start_codon:yes stop_codon:yes gene_type:complete